MAGGTVTDGNRPMHIRFKNIVKELAMADKAEFSGGPDQADGTAEIMAILTFFFRVRKVSGDMATDRHTINRNYAGSRIEFSLTAVCVVLLEDLFRGNRAWHPVKNSRQDLMTSGSITTDEKREHGHNAYEKNSTVKFQDIDHANGYNQSIIFPSPYTEILAGPN